MTFSRLPVITNCKVKLPNKLNVNPWHAYSREQPRELLSVKEDIVTYSA